VLACSLLAWLRRPAPSAPRWPACSSGRALARRAGERAARGAQAGDSVTAQATEEIPFERTRQTKQTQDEKRQEKDLKTAMQGSNKSEIVGRRARAARPGPSCGAARASRRCAAPRARPKRAALRGSGRGGVPTEAAGAVWGGSVL
jgi:hypothetical protein